MIGELISRSALIEKIESTDWYHISEIGTLENGANSNLHTPLFKADDILSVVENAPTIEAEPVRHGRWLVDGLTGMSFCSECQDYAVEADTNYCPNCGAKMDGGAADD